MDSSPVLRQQSQNKIRCDFQRMKNEQNKKQAEPKLFKLLPSPCLSDKDGENKDAAESCRRPPLQLGVSRLPVLAKSLHLQTPSDFNQSHLRWEEKALSGKAKKKKPNTRPLPFNLSQPKNTKWTAENRQPLPAPQSRTHAVKSENKHCNAKPPKRPAALSSKGDSTKVIGKFQGKTPEKVSQLLGQSGPFNASKTLSNPQSSVASGTMHQNKAASSVQPAVSAEICLDNMNLLSLKDASKISNAGQTAQPTMQGNPSKALNVENFQPDHAALLSILRNEGVGIMGRISATSQSKAYNYLPQRVSVMKNQQKAGSTTASVKSAQFSPDPAALQSILDEGVKDRGPVGATPKNSASPFVRGTSTYTAQRVPVTKNCAGTVHPVAALKETPLKKWTPQRVRNTLHQPMSAMKWHQLTQQSLYGTPGGRNCKSNLQLHQEDVVQRLFDDPKDEQTINVMDQALQNEAPSEEKLKLSKTSSEEEEKEQNMLLQAPPRESVIFFSVGKKQLRVQRFENLESASHQNQHGPVSSDQGKVPTAHNDISAEVELSQINAVLHLHRGLAAPKAYPNPAVAMLRKRFPPLEELRLDEEVASYTSVSVPDAPGFAPPLPRCGNPLASILHFEESNRFLPIGFDLSAGPLSLHGSPLHQR
ncbi:uncharacterized protein LOC121652238 isoform X3 [Melanotaenia boesemani]|uniref:uncharacterized protein LOC121652238 isoform X3 n=1 Tax=Melanotaenia boesemani TaxID=1250792 RepID=UPI001C03EBC3|nr:uncharacterized protein LOC121652238 isoform X3 [Melanotaenia boesemani]